MPSVNISATTLKKGFRGRSGKPHALRIKGKIDITKLAPQFASGAENLEIEYKIEGCAKEEVLLRVLCDQQTGTQLVFERKLKTSERADGSRKLSWNGKASAGPQNGKFIGPALSPYRVILQIVGGKLSEKTTAVKIAELKMLKPSNASFFMNNPTSIVRVEAQVSLLDATGNKKFSAVPIDVRFTFTDPGGNNTTKAASFAHAPPAALGKAGDPNAKFWSQEAGTTATSTDGFKTQCDVVTLPTGADRAKAKVKFKPGAVGGDDYELDATVFAHDGTTQLATVKSPKFEIFRRVRFEPYEMAGQTHISTHGTSAKMQTYYTAATFVKYELGAITTLGATFSVRYIGLWDHATQAMKNWATSSAKTAAETPTATETTDANGPAGPAQVAARAAIQVKADAWRDRIIADYNHGLNNWAPDAGVPADAMVAIEFEHPKYTAGAPNADSVTNEWGAFPWLTITVEGRAIHPDRRWINGQGLSFGGRAYVIAGMSAARTEVCVAHEAGHETKNQFKRKPFGAGDHSGAGLMDPVGSQNSFTAGEVDILRGLA